MLVATLIGLFVFGLVVGSFLNVIIWRLPRGTKPNGRSVCAKCGHILGALDLIPVLSFLFLGGKCRYCKNKISPRYIIIELLTAVLFTLGAWFYPIGSFLEWLVLIRYLLVICFALVVFVIDLEHFLILDTVVLTGSVFLLPLTMVILWLSGSSLLWSTVSVLLGALVVALFFYILWVLSKNRAHPWIGFGDVKFGLLFGGVLAWPVALCGLFLSYLIGTVTALPLLIFGFGLKSRLPFGVFLTVAWVVSLLFGTNLVAWYMRLIGFSGVV